MVSPIKTVRRVHKRTKKFIRHQSDRYKKVKVSVVVNGKMEWPLCWCPVCSVTGGNPRGSITE